jgi:hypothetical protein
MTAGEVEVDALEGLPHPPADLDESQPQRPELQMGLVASCEPPTDGVEEPVGGRVEREPELVGPEGMTTQAIGEAAVLEILNAQLGPIAPSGVPVIQRLRRIIPGGHHKVEFEPFLQRLCLVDHPPLTLPGACLILTLGKQSHLLARLSPLLGRLLGEGSSQRLQPAVRRQTDGIGDVLRFQVVVERGDGKAGVRSDLDCDLGPAATDEPDQPFEDR